MSDLKSKTPLKAKKPLKANPSPKKRVKPTITLLRRKADKLFSRYVRLRDSERRGSDEWYGTCITCSYTARVAWIDDTGKLRFDRNWDAGHYITRGYHVTRFEEENVNLQCSYRCNRFRGGEREKYKIALDLKYGKGIAKKLEKMAKTPKPLTRDYLEEVIADSITQIDWYEKH